ncbi:unnamed protein product [Darwinula stevensoni]|uniref:Uncharacterized protein n=1 Tax=Darwinula stevensoni TaxID=69355 RepID=A0A7R8XD23_9CRUS|nr:unnamed protein product [Darwinula stevensoni]CAG0892591.1 unnamed protein product [Darwinula stevensoni]
MRSWIEDGGWRRKPHEISLVARALVLAALGVGMLVVGRSTEIWTRRILSGVGIVCLLSSLYLVGSFVRLVRLQRRRANEERPRVWYTASSRGDDPLRERRTATDGDPSLLGACPPADPRFAILDLPPSYDEVMKTDRDASAEKRLSAA